ncbi:MAG: hypothetical protein GYB68_16650 [Chloroflexi bacterium]|nr:hypothetical protein [Chloroflexota bacterium]
MAATQTTMKADRPVGAQVVLARITMVIVSLFVLLNLSAALMVAGYQIYYDGLIYPGVNVWGIDLSGMTPDEAAAQLEGEFSYPQMSTITFRDGSNIWPITAGELGVHVDVSRTVQAAYEVGRRPALMPSLQEQAAAWQDSVSISPVIVFDQRAAEVYLQGIAAQINQTPQDATITLNGLEVVTTPSRVGRQVDVATTLARLNQMIGQLESGEINLTVVETPPAIANADEAAATINRVLAGDLELYIEGADENELGPWLASPEALAQMIVIEREPLADGSGETYSVRLNQGQMTAFLEPLAPNLARDPSDARFDINPDTLVLTPILPSQEGRRLDIPATVQLVNASLLSGERRVPLVFEIIEPNVADTDTGEDLGIVEMVSSATTFYYGSSANRRVNIREASSRFHGVVVMPGQDFSFNEYLGDVSLESGFESSMIIFDGRTIEGVGGGVCQVSTTVFQTAFYAGFPILERYPHGYRVGYYEVGEGAGMDATVYSPIVDFRFQNDTPYHLLLQVGMNVDQQTLTFSFYSTSDGRTVQKSGPQIDDIIPHGPPRYVENPSLAPGQVKQVDYAHDGSTVIIERIVYRDGAVLYSDVFRSNYVPWSAVYEVAPGYIPPGASSN